MYLLIGFLGLAYLYTFWVGYKRLIQLQHLNQQRILNGLILVMILLTLATLGQGLEVISETVAARFTMFLYTSVAGFFCGFAGKMVKLRKDAGTLEYVYRSFWTDTAPKIIALLVIAFGIYRTGLFTFGTYTGMGITSGLSLIGFGLFGLSLRVVPEIRREGIVILDQFVTWTDIVSYRWESKCVLQIEYYMPDNTLTDFTTYIPKDDQRFVEQLMKNKLNKNERERIKIKRDGDKVN